MINFSLPPFPSFTSRTPNELPILFVPNVPFLLKIIDGDVGISKKIQQRMMQKNLPKLKNKKELKEFSKISGSNLGPNPEQFIKNGKLEPPTKVQIDKTSLNLGGLDAFERSLLQSIFETQKPYVEIAKIVAGLFVELEDIAAHVLGVVAPSSKPKGNPRALGYQGTQKGYKKDGTGGIGAGLNSLSKMQSKKPPQNKMSDNKFSPENIEKQSTPEQSTKFDTGKYIAITLSTIYSTNEFDPNVEYTYIYKDYFEEFDPNIDSDDTNIEEDEDGAKDEAVVLGVYDQNYDPVSIEEVRDKLPWLSEKYKSGSPWPQIKPNDSFDYLYVRRVLGVIVSTRVGSPGDGDGWEILRYGDEGPSLDIEGSKKPLKKGQLALAYNSDKTQNLFNFYKDFYMEYTDKKIQQSLGSTPSTYVDEDGSVKDVKVEARKDIESKISDFSQSGMIPMQLEGLISNNFMAASRNHTSGLTNLDKFDKIAYAFKPKKIDGTWYDIEADYDMKILKCDITSDVTYLQNVGDRERKAKIIRFIKKSYSITFANGRSVSYFIDVADGKFLINNARSITIDYYTGADGTPESGQSRIHILENSRTYQLKNNEFPIYVFDQELPEDLLNFWEYKTGHRVRFVPSGNTFILDPEYKYNNKWYKDPSFTELFGSIINRRPSEFVDEGIIVPYYHVINFNGRQVYIDGLNKFLGVRILTRPGSNISGSLLSQSIPSTNQITNLVADLSTNSVTTSQENKPNLIRVEDTDGDQRIPKIITGLGTNANITNEQLRTEGPLGKEPYGSPILSDQPGESRNQTLEQIFRYPRTIDDVKTYYIIEGVLKSKNKNVLISPAEEAAIKAQGGGKQSSRGSGFYVCCSFELFPICLVGIIYKFIRIVIKIAAKLVPAIQMLINLIKNPPQAITDIIIAKLGDDFGTEVPKFKFYSKEFLDQLKKVKKYATDLKGAQKDPIRKQDIKDELKMFLDTSLLKNYVFISDKGLGRFVLDGVAGVSLFGDAPMLKKLPKIFFGLETNLGSLISPEPQAPFKLIFKVDRLKSGTQRKLPDFLGNLGDNLSKDIKEAALYNANFQPVLTFKNKTTGQAGGISSVEETSTVYSTGTFREDVLYEYIYLTEDVNRLVKEATELEQIGDDPSLAKALDKLQEAQRIDPNNGFIKNKIENLKNLRKNFSTQPLLDFILGLVTLPLKVVFGIITYIMNFFKSLANPFSLITKIIEFVSFKWMLDFFSPVSPNSMFAMAGIMFDIQKYFLEWLPIIFLPDPPKIPNAPNIPGVPNVPGVPNIPNPLASLSFDLNEIIKLPWTTWPTYSLEEIKAITFKKFPLPILILNSILCFIEAVINTFIDFIWAILGLVNPDTGVWIVLEPPYLNICKDTNKDLSPKDIAKLLNLNPLDGTSTSGATAGEGRKFNPSTTDNEAGDTFNFVYYIRTSDGRDVRDLNQQELDVWMEENADLQYTFNF